MEILAIFFGVVAFVKVLMLESRVKELERPTIQKNKVAKMINKAEIEAITSKKG